MGIPPNQRLEWRPPRGSTRPRARFASSRFFPHEQLTIFGDRHAAPSPILHLDFLEDDPSPVERLAEHVEQHLAHSLVDGGLLLGRYMVDARFGSLAGQLDGDDRHGMTPDL